MRSAQLGYPASSLEEISIDTIAKSIMSIILFMSLELLTSQTVSALRRASVPRLSNNLILKSYMMFATKRTVLTFLVASTYSTRRLVTMLRLEDGTRSRAILTCPRNKHIRLIINKSQSTLSASLSLYSQIDFHLPRKPSLVISHYS